MTVPRRALGRLTLIAQGAFGAVYRVDGYRLPGSKQCPAYKEFLTVDDRTDLVRAATAAVSFRESLQGDDVDDLDTYTTWPRELVTDDHGEITGFLMPLLTDDFFISVDDSPNPPKRKVQDLSWLIATPAQLQANGTDIEVDPVHRRVLMAQLCYAIGRLHKHGWIYGDLSYKNACFALDPPRLVLIDCDGVAQLADSSRRQGNTLFWTAPENDGRPPLMEEQNFSTDVYKVSLAILRCMLPGPRVSTTQNPQRLAGVLSTAELAMLERGLSTVSSERPTLKELFVHLDDEISRLVTPPEIRAARVVNTLCIRGFDVVVEWEVSGATEITIRATGRRTVTLDPDQHPDGYAFPMVTSGTVTIEAANKYGRARAELGPIMVWDLPDLDVALPGVPGLPVAPVATHLAAISEPMASASFPTPDLPEIAPAGLQIALRDVFGPLKIDDMRPQFGQLFSWPSTDDANRAEAQGTRAAGRVRREVDSAADRVRGILADALTSSLRTHLRQPTACGSQEEAS